MEVEVEVDVEVDVEEDVEEDETNNARMDQSPAVLMVLPPSLMATARLLPALTEASRGPALMGAHRSGSVEAEEEGGAGEGARSAVTGPLRHMTETGALRPAVTAAGQSVPRTSARRREQTRRLNVWSNSKLSCDRFVFILLFNWKN